MGDYYEQTFTKDRMMALLSSSRIVRNVSHYIQQNTMTTFLMIAENCLCMGL